MQQIKTFPKISSLWSTKTKMVAFAAKLKEKYNVKYFFSSCVDDKK